MAIEKAVSRVVPGNSVQVLPPLVDLKRPECPVETNTVWSLANAGEMAIGNTAGSLFALGATWICVKCRPPSVDLKRPARLHPEPDVSGAQVVPANTVR